MSKTNAECVANQNSSIWSDFAMRNLTDLTKKFRVAFYSTKIHISTNLLNNGLCDTAMKCTEICVQITSQQEWKDSTFLLRFAYRFSSWTDGIVTMLCSIRCLFRISFVHLLKFSWLLLLLLFLLWFSLALFFFVALCSVCVRKPSIEPHILTNIFQFNENKILFWLEIHANPCTCTSLSRTLPNRHSSCGWTSKVFYSQYPCWI